MPSYPRGLGLVIGCPHGKHQVVIDWAYYIAQLHPPMNYEVRWISLRNHPVDEARNMIMQAAIEQKAKYVYFIDDDVTMQPHALRQLIYHLDHHEKYAVAGGIYCHKSPPQMPMVFRGNGMGPYWEWKIGEVFDVSGIGMGATLIRVAAVTGDDTHPAIEAPWFKTVDSVDAYRDGVPQAEAWTEDLYFCKKVEEAGWGLMADGGLLGRHWDLNTGIGYSLPEGSKPTLLPEVPKGTKTIIELGCGAPEESLQTTEGEVLRVDWREDCKPDYRCDVSANLPWPSESFDLVFSSHTLEHFDRLQVPGVLTEWARLVKPTGEIRMTLPNIEWAAQKIVNAEIDSNVMNVLYGAQTYALNFHKTGFTPKIIEQLLVGLGFKKFVWDFHNYHMLVRAWKDADAKEEPIVKLARTPMPPDQTKLEYEKSSEKVATPTVSVGRYGTIDSTVKLATKRSLNSAVGSTTLPRSKRRKGRGTHVIL